MKIDDAQLNIQYRPIPVDFSQCLLQNYTDFPKKSAQMWMKINKSPDSIWGWVMSNKKPLQWASVRSEWFIWMANDSSGSHSAFTSHNRIFMSILWEIILQCICNIPVTLRLVFLHLYSIALRSLCSSSVAMIKWTREFASRDTSVVPILVLYSECCEIYLVSNRKVWTVP